MAVQGSPVRDTVRIRPEADGLLHRSDPSGTSGPKGLDARPGLPIVILVATYACSRIIAAVAGVRYDDSVIRGTPLTDMWQLLDVRLLKNDLISSVWHLNMQPPAFNLYAGLLVKLPLGVRRPFEVVMALTLGLTMVLCAYLLQVEMRVPRSIALVVTIVCVVASPAYVLYENWLNYAYPTAAFGTFAAWCLIRFLRTSRARFGLGFFAGYATIYLLDSTFQVEWLLVATVVVFVVLRRQWRTVLLVATLPLAVVATWTIKDYVQVGTTTTSSWLGMNLARDVLYRAPTGEIAALVRSRQLNPLAAVTPFSGPKTYAPGDVPLVRSPIPAIGRIRKADGSPNFNNPLYVAVSSRYLHDDLTWIRAFPGEYTDDVFNSVGVWLVATDQNFTNSANWPSVNSYARLYDWAVEWQPTRDRAPAYVVFFRGWHKPAWLSEQAILVYLLALGGAPFLAWARRRSDPALAGTLAVLWWTVAYGFATSSLIEIGENERFRSELGPVPLVVAVVVATAAVRAVWWRTGARRRIVSADVPVEGLA